MAKTSKTSNSITHDISSTGDLKTDDFNLNGEKIPALSTLKAQIKVVMSIINTQILSAPRVEFDRLRIGINIGLYGRIIHFEDFGMEDVENPKEPPSYLNKNEGDTLTRRSFMHEEDDDEEYDISDLFDSEEEYKEYLETEKSEKPSSQESEAEPDIFSDFSIKRRIRYDDYKRVVGLNNMFLFKGYFVVDIPGKWMADSGVLGSLHRDNIREALQKVIELGIVNFNIDEFIRHAQVFICDVVVDIQLESQKRVSKHIDGISSFCPIPTNRYNIAKYGRHGLMLKPKAQKAGFSLVIYSKGQELDYSYRRTTKATLYTDMIGDTGVELAEKTLRFELKLFSLASIRKNLDIAMDEVRIVRLTDVLNCTVPVLLKQIELFTGKPEQLLERLNWLQNIETTTDDLTLNEIFIAERFIEILRDNNFDINIARSHIRTEYANATDKELEEFTRLANIRRNILTFLVYRKPKSVTIMLDILCRLHAYYQAETVNRGNNG